MNHIYSSPIFDDDKKEIITLGVDFYFKKNYMAAMHILIPCIEDTIRNFVGLLGGDIFKVSKNNEIQLKTLHEILNDNKLLKVLKGDMLYYFKVLFTDQKGLNLRNNICHGFYDKTIFNYAIADRLIHSLLCLSLIKKQEL